MASNCWAVLAEPDSDGDAASPVAAAPAPKGVAAAAQKKPTSRPAKGARRVSFAPLPEPLHARSEESVDFSVAPTGRLSAVAAAADLGSDPEGEWAGRDFTPVLEIMLRDPSVSWGDLVYVEPPQRQRANTMEDFWAQPWSAGLTELWSDAYDTSRLSDSDWEAMMTWLFDNGWDVSDWDRQGVSCEPDNAPPRVWIAPRILEELAEADAAAPRRGYSRSCGRRAFPEPAACCSHSAGVPSCAPKPAAKKVAVVIPRFCRAGAACAEAGCRYTHGDTIPVQNKPCAFDGRCSGDKRATCTYFHPSEGEVWTADLVRHRPSGCGPSHDAAAPAASD